MNVLSLRFVGMQHKITYRIALEIGLIVTLLILTSGIINGVSTQFSSLLIDRNGSNDYFIGIEKGSTIEESKIPQNVIDSLSHTSTSYFSQFIIHTVQVNSSLNINYYFTNLSELVNNKDNFLLVYGRIPSKLPNILIGESLASQLGIGIDFPQEIMLTFNGTTLSRTIVGMFEDSGPWYYGLLDDITNYWSNLTYVNGFEMQIKNNKILDSFKEEINFALLNSSAEIDIDLIKLNQAETVSISFHNELKVLFTILLEFCFLFLFLKLLHSSYVLFQQLYHQFWICKLLGMTKRQLQFLYWKILAITGNLGIIFGFILGLVLPQVLVFGLKPLFNSQNFNIVPSLNDMVIVFILSNILFFINSFWTYKLRAS